MKGGFGELILFEFLLVLSELLHFCLDFFAGVLELLLLFDFSRVDALLKEIAQALEFFHFFFHVEFGLLLHCLGGGVLELLLKLVKKDDALGR